MTNDTMRRAGLKQQSKFDLQCLVRLMLAAMMVMAARVNAMPAEEFSWRLGEILAQSEHPYLANKDLDAEVDDLRELYEHRDVAPLWSRSGSASKHAIGLLTALAHAEREGLDPHHYEVEMLRGRLYSLTPASSPAAWAEWDVAVSTVAMRFVRHLRHGRINPLEAGFDLPQRRSATNFADAVARFANGADLSASISAIEPDFHHYRLLKRALARYRTLAENIDVQSRKALTNSSALRRHLIFLGDLPAEDVADDVAKSVLADTTTAGLVRFQERHGLEPDGVLGSRTLEALNVPLSFRIRQLELTMERWRWLPDFNSPPIVVNIPQYRLYAFQFTDDREDGMLAMDVVVGQDYENRRTPVFLGSLQYVVFRPYWNVPPGITLREILPALRRDPGYLQRNHMELVAGTEDNSPVVAQSPESTALLESGELRVRQLPGPDNALGDVKFILPNSYHVYLHSTPARSLFRHARRAFSHGCIRVSDPAALAAHVLRNASGDWSLEQVAQAMRGEPNQRVDLEHPIPVMILYGTAVAAESGRVYFLDDVYGQDRQLQDLLGMSPINETLP